MNRYGCPTTYKRIVPDRGCGFILKRIYELTEAPGLLPRPWPRKIDVYLNTRWYNRPGFASLLWSSLIKDGLIESDGGMQEYKYCCYSFRRYFEVKTRAAGRYERGCGYTVRYHLTSKGRGVLFDMMDRVNAKNKTQPKPNTVGSVAKFDAKKDGRELPHSVKVNKGYEYDFLKNMTKTDLICEYRNAAMEADRLNALLLENENDFAIDTRINATYSINAEYNSVCAKRDALAREIERREKNETHDILKKETVNCTNLAPDYIDEIQKLRAEKDDLIERLKKIAACLEWFNDEISHILNNVLPRKM